MKRYLKLMGLYALACFGLSGVSISVRNLMIFKDFSQLFASLGSLVTAVVLISLFIKGVRKVWDEWKSETNEASYLQALKTKTLAFSENILFRAGAATNDLSDQEKLISQFRSDYHHFFSKQGNTVHENTPLQNTVSQIFWNILSLQKRRLDKAGISMSLDAQRMCYLNGADSVTGNVLFDGKYEVSEVFEMIRADRSFSYGGKRIARFKSREAARYHLQNVKKTDDAGIICPNCGSISTRENLIDGCDFCHTKFLIEDLGMRVSDFGLFSDYDIESKKYKETRDRLILRAGLIATPFMLVLTVLQTLPQVFASPSFGDSGMLFEIGAFIFFVTFRALFLTTLIIAAALILFSPVLQTKASIIRYGKADLKKMRAAQQQNITWQELIRKHDPLFSLGEFFANIQNKLAAFHYAQDSRQMEAFTEGTAILSTLPQLQERYKNIVHFDVKQMILEGEEVTEHFQNAAVTAHLVLLEQKGNRIRKRKETVHLHLKRNAACQTHSVCAPTVMTCKSCGAPHHILDGRICQHCGHERIISAYDWAIDSYESC